MLTKTPFWFLRHGETDWNAQGLSQGRTDIPLNTVGVMQAERAALTLRDSRIATIIASPLGEWYDEWIEGRYTPTRGETFQELLDRAVRAVNRALAHPAPVLVVAHGALFRALRLALGHEPNVRTPNALPLHVTPPADGGRVWGIAPAVLAEG